MSRKVLIDCDPGIGDAVALCIALFDPRVEVIAITGSEGSTTAKSVNRNIQSIVEQLDPPLFPRMGVAQPLGRPLGGSDVVIDGPDGLGGCNFQVSQLHNQHPAEKVIHDVVRANPDQVTILSLGPLTNIATAFQRDPDLMHAVGQLVILGGSVQGIGDVSAAAEFNVFYDPEAARSVFHSRTTKTLIPLDVTSQLILPMDFVQQLPDEESAVGRFLHRIIPYLFRAHRQHLGLEGIYLHGVVALLAILQPGLFETTEMFGDVEIQGTLARGATVFDRRSWSHELPNMEVAMAIDRGAAIDCILRGIRHAAEKT